VNPLTCANKTEARFNQRDNAVTRGLSMTSLPDPERIVNQLAFMMSTCFTAIRCLPTVKISTQNEEFSTDLNDLNLLFFNDSAEMPHGKTRQTRCIGNIQKHPFRGDNVDGFHCFLPQEGQQMHLGCQSRVGFENPLPPDGTGTFDM